MRSVFVLLCCVPLCFSGTAKAQQSSTPTKHTEGAQDLASVLADHTLSGVITDTDGALVPGARVTLFSAGSNQPRSTVTGQDGHFSFHDVSTGQFKLTVVAEGLEGATTQGTLNEDESLELPPIALHIASANTDVEVSSLSQQEIAEVQIKQEEQQRLAGLVPNFYVTYDWHAAPLTTKQKYKLAVRSIVDPATFIIIGGFAGIEQASNSYSGYGQGAAGYGKRYGAGFANASIGGMLGGAVLPSLFHQDPRYFYKGTGSIPSRIFYALSTSVIARGDNGRWQPAYASVLGDFSSGAISNLYYPASNRDGAALTIENGFLAVASDALGNLLQEFVLKKISSGVKAAGKMQP